VKRLLLVVVLAAACTARGDDDVLDGQGRAMLDLLRLEALRPDALIARLSPKPDAVIADVGAGPGFLSLPLARAVPAGKVIATDIREDYLRALSRRASDAKLSNITTVVSGRERPGLAPSSVDLIVLCQVDHYLVDRARYFGELAAALRPGGRLAIVNYRRYRDADLEAAKANSLQVADEWAPSLPFFLLVLTPTRGAQ
jgi:ubiquinone/menaquinone biosynthesis C-methylase UbiE